MAVPLADTTPCLLDKLLVEVLQILSEVWEWGEGVAARYQLPE